MKLPFEHLFHKHLAMRNKGCWVVCHGTQTWEKKADLDRVLVSVVRCEMYYSDLKLQPGLRKQEERAYRATNTWGLSGKLISSP